MPTAVQHIAPRMSALTHYVIWRCKGLSLGSTKLNKILWFSDVEAYRQLGASISGAHAYLRLQFGPVPYRIQEVLGTLSALGDIKRSLVEYHGLSKTDFEALTEPDVSVFTQAQLDIVDEVADAICRQHSAVSISAVSHDDLWEEVPTGQPIPIEAAGVIFAKPTADDVKWAEDLLCML